MSSSLIVQALLAMFPKVVNVRDELYEALENNPILREMFSYTIAAYADIKDTSDKTISDMYANTLFHLASIFITTVQVISEEGMLDEKPNVIRSFS